MHVMVISPDGLPIPPSKGGSVQIYLSHLLSEMASHRDVQVTLVSPGRDSDRLPGSPSATHVTLEGSKEKYWEQVRDIITSHNPDVIQIDNRPAQARAILREHPQKPIILNMHSLTFLGKRHLSAARSKDVLQRVHAVVCNSRDLERAIRKNYDLPASWTGHVIYPGVREKATLRTRNEASRVHTFKVLFVGRVIRQKGVHVLINAIRILTKQTFPSIELTVVGPTHNWERPYRKELRKMARGLNVTFTGFVPPEELSSFYQSHDILVCPSQKHEAFGLVNLEAMAHGLPVVASKIGGIPEAVGTRGAILVSNYRDAAAFASAIQSMLASRDYKRYSEGALYQARQFTWKKTAQDFVSLYHNVRRDK